MRESHSLRNFGTSVVFECARGLSALWVFMFHIADSFKNSSFFLYSLAKCGYHGVAVFFVISGYCIYSAAENTLAKGQHPNTFLLRRLIRVMPPFWASIILVVTLPYLVEVISSLKYGVYISPSPRWLHFDSLDWLRIATLTQIFFNKNGDLQEAFSSVNAVYWSLAIELQFYLVIYAIIFFKSKWRNILIAILFISLLSFAAPMILNSGLFFAYWPAFFLGILLRWAHQNGITPNEVFGKNYKLASCGGATVVILFVLIFIFLPVKSEQLFLGEEYKLQFIFSALIAAIFLWMLGGIEYSLTLSRISPSRKSKFTMALLLPLCWLGQSSYSLYLLHGQLQQLPAMFIRQIVSPESLLFPLLTLLITAILCFWFYKLVEVPFQNLGKVLTDRNPATSEPRQSINLI